MSVCVSVCILFCMHRYFHTNIYECKIFPLRACVSCFE